MGHFNHLHPEYEVTDFLEGRRFLDFAYIRPPFRIVIEVDGFGPHVRDISRRQFCDQWVRQMHLVNDNWIIIRIGYDDIKERPHMWQQLILQMIGRLFGDSDSSVTETDCIEHEILRLAYRLNRPIKLDDIQNKLNCGTRYARGLMKGLADKRLFLPAGGGTLRIHSWQVNRKSKHLPF